MGAAPGQVPGEIMSVGEHRLHVVDEGQGPPLLLMAALGSNWFDLDPLARRLARDWRVIRYDRPGYGLSSPLTRGYRPSLRAEVDRMNAVLDALGVAEPVTVAGHSMASLYVEAFARLRPDRTAGVVMLDGSFVLLPWRLVPLSFRIGNAHRLVGSLRRLTARVGIRRWPSGRIRRRVLPEPPEGFDCGDRYWGATVFGQPPYVLATLVENAAFGALDRALRVLRRTSPMPAVPVLVVVAVAAIPGWDQFWQWKQRRFARVLAAPRPARVVVVRPARHFLVLERPDEVADIVGELGDVISATRR